MPPLEVTDLHVAYGRLPALEAVDLMVPDGALVAVLGPNGAGKSTLLKAIAGLVTPRSGQIRLGGESLLGLAPHERAIRGVCLIPEGRGIFPSLSVADNLRLSLNGNSARVAEYFPVLAERQDQLAGTLSGGEQQMLALARAVGTDPTLLMADELSLGLAPMVVRAIGDTLRRLHEEDRRTVVLVEQYATMALALADLIYILNRGRLVWAGEPGELRASRALAESYLGA
jgi:branched-chain amino acid transport system ATP-binding protein